MKLLLMVILAMVIFGMAHQKCAKQKDLIKVKNQVTKMQKSVNVVVTDIALTQENLAVVQDTVSRLETLLHQVINSTTSTTNAAISNTTCTTNAATTTQPTTEAANEALLITGGYTDAGGWNDRRSVELFFPQSGKNCSLHSLPQERYYHTLDTLPGNIPILCGGSDNTARQSCLYFSSPTSPWTSVNTTLAEGRYIHGSWVHGKDLVLLGGEYSTSTAETLYEGSKFTLDYHYKFGCSIQLEKTVILTGGWHSLDRVRVFNIEGYEKDGPSLLTGRRNHGCGSYYQNGDMVYVVAGGYGSTYLSSTETLREGSTTWSYGATLPRALSDLASVSAGNNIYLIGGYDGSAHRAEILKFENSKWTQIGVMKNGIYGCAATMVKIDGNTCDP